MAPLRAQASIAAAAQTSSHTESQECPVCTVTTAAVVSQRLRAVIALQRKRSRNQRRQLATAAAARLERLCGLLVSYMPLGSFFGRLPLLRTFIDWQQVGII